MAGTQYGDPSRVFLYIRQRYMPGGIYAGSSRTGRLTIRFDALNHRVNVQGTK